MAWPVGIDFENTALRPISEVLPDIMAAVNERCDAARIDRLFFVDDGNPNAAYSGAITSITITFSSDPGSFYSRGAITLSEGTAFDEFSYTAVSGSGTSRTFTVSTTLTGSYTTAADAVITDIDTDNLHLYAVSEITGAIDSKISALIPAYADQSQATGTEYVDKTSIPPWTEANILTEIGDNERVSGGLYPTSEWVAQVYNIINTLVWVILRDARGMLGQYAPFNYSDMIRVGSLGNDNSTLNEMKRVLHQTTWAGVSGSWPAGWSHFAIGTSNMYSQGSYDGQYDGRMLAWDWKYLTTPRFKHAAELYLYSETAQVGNPGVDTSQYDAQTYNLVEDKYKKFTSLPATSIGPQTFDVQGIFTAVGAPPEPAITFYAAADGAPDGPYSGAITSITINFSSDPGTFNSTGNITLENFDTFDFDSFSYTAVSGSGTSRTFTVSTTLTGSYDTDDYAYASSSPAREPTTDVYRGFLIPWIRTGVPGETMPIPPHVAILRFDITDGFSYQ